jgi:hypothetical protein
MPMAFMGSCLAGAIATSHAFLSFNVSISSGEGLVRGVTALPLPPLGCWFWRAVVDVKPGGSARAPLRDLLGGVELRSRTHWGGGGGAAMVVVL